MVETRDNEYKAYFTVVGDFDPADLTVQIGLHPTSSWKKGDRNEKTHLERKFSRWNLDSRLDQFASLEAQIADVLKQLKPKVDEIHRIGKVYGGGGMQLVGWFYQDFPGLHFEKELLADLAHFELSLDCDFYYMYSDKREDS